MTHGAKQKAAFFPDDIAEPGARCFRLQTPGVEKEGFIIRFAGEIRAYLNSCPHRGIDLNWSAEQFFAPEFKLLQCSMHGALFDPLTGLCVRGPCAGERLAALPVTLVDGQVIIYS